ncbi:MAG TPA: hypothetical protein GXX55_04860 [Firmicutes bacterium]|nr:hypothetical protein [Bacillota bacterium]
MTTTLLVFLALAAVSLFAAWRVVTDPQIMHAGLWMGLSFVGVAGIFLLLTAEFLAGVQILIYVGAITTIILFGIMLSDIGEVKEEEPPLLSLPGRAKRPGTPVAVLAAGAFVLALILLYRDVAWTSLPAAGTLSTAPGAGTPAGGLWEGFSVKLIGQALFGEYALPAEAASVLLLAALLGALVLAAREEG